MFENDEHLGLETVGFSAVSVFSSPNSLGTVMTEEELQCLEKGVVRLAKNLREREQQKPVMVFEVDFLDVYRENRFWHVTPQDFLALAQSKPWQNVCDAAVRKGFVADVYAEMFTKQPRRGADAMMVRMKLVFTHPDYLVHGGQRVHRVALRPPKLE